MLDFPVIQYITRDDALYTHAEQALLMFRNGIKWVQIRMKNTDDEAIIQQANLALEYADQYGGKLIINDSVTICKMVRSHGIHLGLKDIPVSEARKELGKDVIIGGTANTLKDILYQAKQGCDYIGLGPFRFTDTKKNLSPVIGLEGYKNMKEELKERSFDIPITAVGGIRMEDIPSILSAGINGVAISGALLGNYRT